MAGEDAPEKKAPPKKATKKAGGAAAAKKAAGGGDGDVPPAKRAKAAETKAAKADAKTTKQEEEPAQPEAFNMKGQLTRDLAVMLYGFGDDLQPLPETLDLVEDVVLDYATTLLHKAMDSAAVRGKLRRPGAPGAGAAVGPEDILFLVRKDHKKYARAKELLIMDEEIKKARQVADVADVAVPQ
ncbi:transcription initiation factor TFIID subunit 13-like [Micractinium conductrix]|uniref:Transcription initiation factor TFIID subunit 13 n=1 Tax=Micractinium conductrix TaxID=554055 RepID=A0A2P6V8N6_9CHLO|nr:transcription initiation factor TFIID subunit 13-like [Micractinium conductrix]|eukprot:PSC70449.1 transcription initiation factor TFIID subunit 13-like [Micractinium conductrix]